MQINRNALFFRNCLFRALADQLYGSQESKKLHARLRQETVSNFCALSTEVLHLRLEPQP